MFKLFFTTLLACIAMLSSIAQNCTANYGTVTPPQGVFNYVCNGGISAQFSVLDNNTSADYSTVFVVANDAGTIVFINTGNEIDFGILDGDWGIFRVHALNIRSTELSLLQTAISIGAIATIADLQEAINNSQFCAALDIQGNQLTVASPISINYTINCDNSVGEYTVSCEVGGGLPALINDATFSYYSYAGSIGATSIEIGDAFTVGPFGDNTSFTLEVSDNLCNQITTVSQADIACTKCHANPGTMPLTSLVNACGGILSIPGALNITVDSGAIYYVIHTNPNDTLGDVLAIDTNFGDGTADFSALLPAGAEYGVTYYVSSVGSNLDDDGMFDWNSECRKVAPGTPVQFLSPIVLNATIDCVPDSGAGSVWIDASGENSPFSIAGSLWTGFLGAGENVQLEGIASGTYNLTVINTASCIAHYEVVVDCGDVSIDNAPDVEQFGMSLIPQPARQTADLYFTATKNGVTKLAIYDLSGKLLHQTVVTTLIGSNTVALDLNAYATGIYLVRLTDGRHTATAKLVVVD